MFKAMKFILLTDTLFKMSCKSQLTLPVNKKPLGSVLGRPASGLMFSGSQVLTLGGLIIVSPVLFVHLLLKIARQ